LCFADIGAILCGTPAIGAAPGLLGNALGLSIAVNVFGGSRLDAPASAPRDSAMFPTSLLSPGSGLPSTIATVLREHGLEPARDRLKKPT